MRLKDKVAVITGGSSGIGQAVAFRFAREGADIVLADIDLDAAEATAATIRGMGRKALAIRTNVTSLPDVKNLFRSAETEFGRINILVNNAGVRHIRSISQTTVDEWNSTLAVNLTGAFLCLQQVVPALRRQGGGKIINMSSITGIRAYGNRAAYAASKAGLEGLTRQAGGELAPLNIQVNSVAPGYIETPMAVYKPEVVAALVKTCPAGRRASADEVAGIAVFLASSDSDYVNATTVVVDGGVVSTLMVDAPPWKAEYASMDDHWD